MSMKLKIVFKKVIFLLIVLNFFAGIFPILLFSAEIDKIKIPSDSQLALEQALKNFATQQQKDQNEITSRLKLRLASVIDNWLTTAKNDATLKLNARLEQNWEKLAADFKLARTHFEYLLRGFDYTVIKSDIVQTTSLTAPYKAMVIIKEMFYVEKYHSPDISNADPYFYTVTTNYTLNFNYLRNDFILENSQSNIVALDNEVPAEIKRLKL